MIIIPAAMKTHVYDCIYQLDNWSKVESRKFLALSNTEGGGKVGAGVTGNSWLG